MMAEKGGTEEFDRRIVIFCLGGSIFLIIMGFLWLYTGLFFLFLFNSGLGTGLFIFFYSAIKRTKYAWFALEFIILIVILSSFNFPLFIAFIVLVIFVPLLIFIVKIHLSFSDEDFSDLT